MSVRPAKHGPCRFNSYVATHLAIMGHHYDKGFVGADTVELRRYIGAAPEADFLMEGEIACRGRIVIQVIKWLEAVGPRGDPDPLIQTATYSYNVVVRPGAPVFRYDNQHKDWIRPDHVDEHHKHVFDWPSVRQSEGSPTWIGADQWPTLGEVIDEALHWHGQHYAQLSDPEGFVTDLQSRLRT